MIQKSDLTDLDLTKKIAVFMAGTHHFPFARLVTLATTYASECPDVQIVLQSGMTEVEYTELPENLLLIPFLNREQTQQLQSTADLIVAHGGPSILLEWFRAGFKPYILPRDPALGEHIDEHQIKFSQFASSHNLCKVIEDIADLPNLLSDTQVRAEDKGRDSTVSLGNVADTAIKFSAVADKLLSQYRGNLGSL